MTTFRNDYCKGCGEPSNQILHNGRALVGYCETCRTNLKRQRHAAANKQNNALIKAEVMAHYGGKCRYCGETNIDKLQIDHIAGNGKAHRNEIGATGTGFQMYYYLRRNNYPNGYQVLCGRCNVAKSDMKEHEFRQWLIDTYSCVVLECCK